MSDATTDPAVGSVPDPRLPQLIDVSPPWTSWHWVVPAIAVASLIPITILINELWATPMPCVVFFAAAVLGALAIYLFVRRRTLGRAHLNKVLSEEHGADLAELVRYGTKLHGSFGVVEFLEATVRGLPKHGYVGVTIRNAVLPQQAPAIDPIPVNFEARPLDEADESLVAFEEAVDALRDDGLPFAPVSERTKTTDPIVRRAKRNIALSGGRFYTGMWCMMIAFGLWQSLTSGHATMMLIAGTAGMILQVFATGGTQSFFRGTQWSVVPGGLLVRRIRQHSEDSRLHVYDRRKSALIVHRIRMSTWVVLVADIECHHRTTVTQHEATLLLRAWLSPVPPPPVEQLTDLM